MGKQLTSVNPVHIDERPGRRNTSYAFDRVALEDWDGECDIPDVTVKELEESYMWQYEGKPPVFIEEEEVYVSSKDVGSEAHRQAYYAISWLESQGLVEGWREI